MNDTLITIILSAIVAILGATGIITSEEGTQLSAYAFDAITGTIGLVELIRAIIRRRKQKRAIREADNCGQVKATKKRHHGKRKEV